MTRPWDELASIKAALASACMALCQRVETFIQRELITKKLRFALLATTIREDQALGMYARVIGRQMAHEQFEPSAGAAIK